MIFRLAIALLLTVALIGNAQQNSRSKRKRTAPQQNFTGCVDQGEGGEFLLLDPKNMRPFAQVKGRGFKTEHLANYLGEKVTVRGRKAAGEPPVIEARSVKHIGPCVPD